MITQAAGTDELLADLFEERARLQRLVRPLTDATWAAVPVPGAWCIADHIAQLAFHDEAAAMAVTAPKRFATHARAQRGPGVPTEVAGQHGDRPGAELLDRLDRAQQAMARAYRGVDPHRRLPWYGTELTPATALAASLLETWGHGVDVAELLGRSWPATDGLRHGADLAVRSLGLSFELLGRPVPTVPVRVELTAPGGGLWCWGREQARDRVDGSAEDLCLVLTGRRDRSEVALRVVGAVAGEWLAVGRAYPGLRRDRCNAHREPRSAESGHRDPTMIVTRREDVTRI